MHITIVYILYNVNTYSSYARSRQTPTGRAGGTI
jgi:hypothetical protein